MVTTQRITTPRAGPQPASRRWSPGLKTTEPLSTSKNVSPAYQLNWGLTVFWRRQPIPDSEWLTQLQSSTEADGVRILKHRFTTGQCSQFFVSTKPHVSPSAMIRSVKGRLQYLVREQHPKAFQRNYAVRSIGAATRTVVEDYVAKQMDRHRMADPRRRKKGTLYLSIKVECPLF